MSWTWKDQDTKAWEGEFSTTEAEISRLRARQTELLRQLDRYQIDTASGARTMAEWASSELDVSHQTASRLMQVARA